jgi:hypothetical protein
MISNEAALEDRTVLMMIMRISWPYGEKEKEEGCYVLK